MIHYIPCLGIGMPGHLEIVVILFIAILLFGNRIPEIARNLGKSLSEFRKGILEKEETKDKVVTGTNNAARMKNSEHAKN